MRIVFVFGLMALLLVGCRDRGNEPSGTTTPSAAAAINVTTTGTSSAGSVTPVPTEATEVAAGSTPVPGVHAVDYSSEASWLCRAGRVDDLCEKPRRVEVLSSGLKTSQVTTSGGASSSVDCFYVYPTVSTDPGVNSDLEPGAAEIGVVVAQAAPFASACRVYAPIYRQLTLTALATGRFSDAVGAATAYGDVVAAWEYYLAHFNEGRRVVLIGHSQGAKVLLRLAQEHIDPDSAARGRLAAAFLLGTSVSVPSGGDVGGDFKNIPACRSASQQGCVIAYSTFNEASPPPPLSLFGRVTGLRNEALCVDPGALTGGALSTWITTPTFRLSSRTGKAADVTTDADYVEYSGLISSRCVKDGQFSYLSVALNGEGSAWGVSIPPYTTGAVWGLHNLDVSISLGNLVALVRGYGD